VNIAPDDLEVQPRRLFSELLGTFLLVLVAAGGPVVNAFTHGDVSRSAQVVAPGLMVMAVIYFMGAIGGAHLNPVVTISFALRQNFPWRRVPGYVAMQLMGATLVGDHWGSWWVFVVGPLIGGVVAVATAWALRGPPSPKASKAAQGTWFAKRAKHEPPALG